MRTHASCSATPWWIPHGCGPWCYSVSKLCFLWEHVTDKVCFLYRTQSKYGQSEGMVYKIQLTQRPTSLTAFLLAEKSTRHIVELSVHMDMSSLSFTFWFTSRTPRCCLTYNRCRHYDPCPRCSTMVMEQSRRTNTCLLRITARRR